MKSSPRRDDAHTHQPEVSSFPFMTPPSCPHPPATTDLLSVLVSSWRFQCSGQSWSTHIYTWMYRSQFILTTQRSKVRPSEVKNPDPGPEVVRGRAGRQGATVALHCLLNYTWKLKGPARLVASAPRLSSLLLLLPTRLCGEAKTGPSAGLGSSPSPPSGLHPLRARAP